MRGYRKSAVVGRRRPSNRPSIPVDIARQVLFEAGHRCAVCGVECPLERAHIIPWRECREHTLDNLICLCANCHGRADTEGWSDETLLEYKERPWVLRHRDAQASTIERKINIKLTVNLSLENFTEHYQRLLTHAVASFLDVSPEDVKVKKIELGSVIVTLEVPLNSVDRLSSHSDFCGFAKHLGHLKVEKLEVVNDLSRPSEEEQLARMWERLLGLKDIGYSDNFFECGGSSLLLLRLQGDMEEEFGIDLPVIELFTHPTIASMAKRIRELREFTGVGMATVAAPPESQIQIKARARAEQRRLRSQRSRRKET